MSNLNTHKLTCEKRRVALTSVVAALFLTAIKLSVGLWTKSLGLISDAAHSGLDFLAALMTLFSVSIADRPADKTHPYGHQKIDNLAALVESLLLVAASVWIVYEAIERLFFKAVLVTVNPVSFAIIIICIVVDFFRCTALSRAAKKTGSAALEANAYHFLSDVATSLVVLIGLTGIALGYPQTDAICSITVAFFILSIAMKLGRKSIDVLTDRVPDDHIEQIRRAALTVPGVGDVYDVRVRHAGNRHFIDLKAGIQGIATLGGAHAVSEAIEKQLRASFDNADVLVHIEPSIGQTSGVTETVLSLAHSRGINVHRLQLLHTENGLQCTMHLEWPADIRLGDAHYKATELENEIKQRFPFIASVSSHLECSEEGRPSHRTDITDRNTDFIETIRKVARESNCGGCEVREIHIMEAEEKWDIDLICVVPPELTLREAHRRATLLENRIVALCPNVNSVHVHTEPEHRSLSSRTAS